MRVSYQDFMYAVEYMQHNKVVLSANVSKIKGLLSPCQQCVLRSGKAVYFVADELANKLALTSLDRPRAVKVTKLPTAHSDSKKQEIKRRWEEAVKQQEASMMELANMMEDDL